MNSIRLSILDNNRDFLTLLKLGLEDNFALFATNDTKEFIDKVHQPSVLVVDWELDYGATGLDVMREVFKTHTYIHFIFVSAVKNADVLATAINEGWGCYFLFKDDADFWTELVVRIGMAKKLLKRKIDMVANAFKMQQNIENTFKELDNL